ncbi:MAG: DUF190 domain-containing protein [Acidimicrobiales bacterium]
MAIAAGGALGALARYGVATLVPVGAEGFPWPTLGTNLSGALVLSIVVGEADQHGHQPVYVKIVAEARRQGLAGATVLRGIEGFGATSHLHHEHALRLSIDQPVTIVIVDQPAQIDAFLGGLGELVPGGLVEREPAEVSAYRGGRRR